MATGIVLVYLTCHPEHLRKLSNYQYSGSIDGSLSVLDAYNITYLLGI